jgi:coenzyme F420-reducing hydrogenase beta subunit
MFLMITLEELQKVLREHLEENGITEGELISFREKGGSVLRVKKGSQTIYKKSAAKDNYYRAFHKNLTLRESCHSCDFAKSERCADITIGDFWGLGSDAPISRKNGVSLVLINTQKGKTFWEACCQEFSFAERSLEEAVAGNHPLKFPAPRPKEREQFIKLYEQLGFNAAIKSVLPQQSSFSLLRRIARKIKHLLKR